MTLDAARFYAAQRRGSRLEFHGRARVTLVTPAAGVAALLSMRCLSDAVPTGGWVGRKLKVVSMLSLATVTCVPRPLGLVGSEIAQAQVDTIRLCLLRVGALVRTTAHKTLGVAVGVLAMPP